MGVLKMDRYFSKLLDETPYYVVATALHPLLGIQWFDQQWRLYPKWVTKAKNIFKKYWQSISKSADSQQSRIEPSYNLRQAEPPRKKRRLSDSSSSGEEAFH